MQLLTNHLGYERLGSKQAIILTPEPLVTPGSAELVSYPSGQTVMTLPIKANTPIAQWHIGLTYQVDFSACQQVGQYAIRYQGVLSSCFTIAEGLLFEQTFSNVIHYLNHSVVPEFINKQIKVSLCLVLMSALMYMGAGTMPLVILVNILVTYLTVII